MARTAVIIGGGMAGLSAAAALSRLGLSVQLFEARDKLGGAASNTVVDGFSFHDGAVFLALPQLLRRVFHDLGICTTDAEFDGLVHLHRIPHQSRTMLPGGEIVDHIDGTQWSVSGGASPRCDAAKSAHEMEAWLRRWEPVCRIVPEMVCGPVPSAFANYVQSMCYDSFSKNLYVLLPSAVTIIAIGPRMKLTMGRTIELPIELDEGRFVFYCSARAVVVANATIWVMDGLEIVAMLPLPKPIDQPPQQTKDKLYVSCGGALYSFDPIKPHRLNSLGIQTRGPFAVSPDDLIFACSNGDRVILYAGFVPREHPSGQEQAHEAASFRGSFRTLAGVVVSLCFIDPRRLLCAGSMGLVTLRGIVIRKEIKDINLDLRTSCKIQALDLAGMRNIPCGISAEKKPWRWEQHMISVRSSGVLFSSVAQWEAPKNDIEALLVSSHDLVAVDPLGDTTSSTPKSSSSRITPHASSSEKSGPSFWKFHVGSPAAQHKAQEVSRGGLQSVVPRPPTRELPARTAEVSTPTSENAQDLGPSLPPVDPAEVPYPSEGSPLKRAAAPGTDSTKQLALAQKDERPSSGGKEQLEGCLTDLRASVTAVRAALARYKETLQGAAPPDAVSVELQTIVSELRQSGEDTLLGAGATHASSATVRTSVAGSDVEELRCEIWELRQQNLRIEAQNEQILQAVSSLRRDSREPSP